MDVDGRRCLLPFISSIAAKLFTKIYVNLRRTREEKVMNTNKLNCFRYFTRFATIFSILYRDEVALKQYFNWDSWFFGPRSWLHRSLHAQCNSEKF